VGSFRDCLSGLAPDVAARMLAAFQEVIDLIGLPGFVDQVKGIDAAVLPEYSDAIVQGLRMSHLIPGLVALVAGVIAYVALGHRDPVHSVFDYADERGAAATPPTAVAAASDTTPGT